MVKFALFYDEVDAAPKAEADEPSITDRRDASGVGANAGGDLYRFLKRRKKETVQWLGVLFLSTVALLAFQLFLGWTAGAVTLVADSAHTGADAVSYGLNAFIEWLKLPAAKNARRAVTFKSLTRISKIIDTAGSLASLLTLLFATWFAITESMERLQSPSGKGSETIGPALLFFAIASIVIHVGLLALYKRRHQRSTKESQESAAFSSQPTAPVGKRETRDEEKAEFDWENFDPTALRFCAPCGMEDPTAAQLASDAIAKLDAAKLGSDPKAADAPGGFSPVTADESMSFLSALHMAVHPGCTCGTIDMTWGSPDDNVADAADATDEKSEAVPTTMKQPKNLNVIAAMLHLVTDLLRSVLILIAAIIIKFGVVHDAEHTDAICALAVGFLICIGSLALMLRVAARLYACCRGGKSKGSADGNERRADAASSLP